jgi:hypothetical protein
MRLTLGRGWWRRVPIHDTWRREHNIWAGRWGVRITVRIRGRRIVPRIGARRRWIRCTWKGLGRVLGKRRRVGYLFSPRGSGRLFLVAAHELLSGVGVVLRRWHGEGHKNVEDYAGHDDFVEQEQGEDEWESDKRDGVPRLWSFGISRSRRRSDSAGDAAPPQFRGNLACNFTTATYCNLSISLSETMRWRSSAGR